MTVTAYRSHSLAWMIQVTQAGCRLWPPEAVAHSLITQMPLCTPWHHCCSLLLPLASHLARSLWHPLSLLCFSPLCSLKLWSGCSSGHSLMVAHFPHLILFCHQLKWDGHQHLNGQPHTLPSGPLYRPPSLAIGSSLTFLGLPSGCKSPPLACEWF